jgi:predicted acylesterase/phospholipase RssA
MSEAKKILFCRSGGGLPGLDIHCGIWRALEKAGIVATDCIGTSAGAVIGALDAARYSAAAACRIVSDLHDSDVIRERFAWKARFMWIDHICEQEPIKKLLEKLFSVDDILTKNFTAVTNRVFDGMRIDWQFNSIFDPHPAQLVEDWPADMIQALLASMAISGIFPWVTINGRDYTDGGTRANLPLPGNWQKHDEIWLLVATCPIDYRKRYTNVLSRLLLNLDFYAMDQIRDVMDEINQKSGPQIRIIWPKLFADKGVLHFDHSLIDQAETQTEQILQEGRFL